MFDVPSCGHLHIHSGYPYIFHCPFTASHVTLSLRPRCRHVRTVVLDLDDMLVHSDWTRGRGWRTFKRPGADDFLRQLVSHFELVVYTSQLPTYADPILDRLDPHRFIQFRLYR